MANEERLIYANTLYEELSSLSIVVTGLRAGKCVLNEFMKQYRESVLRIVDEQATVDAVEADEVKAFAADVAYQFGCYGQYNGRLHIDPGGLSTLEWAFDILGWENPHPVPECECEIDGCHEHATCGSPTEDGYKRMCCRHMLEKIPTEDIIDFDYEAED